MPTLTCSLIVSVYDQASELAVVLASVASQTRQDFEVIIADDGSHDALADTIARFRSHCPHIQVACVRQDDLGFRKTRILNRAIRTMVSDYCVVIDGDMLLHRRFIENHLRYRRHDRVLCGYRGVKLGPRYTERLLTDQDRLREGIGPLVWRSLRGDLLSSPWRGLVLHNRTLRRLAVPRRSGLAGCNFSLYRQALQQVNGLDESICEYGYEDYELGARLQRAGLHLFNVSKCCNTYHLYHAKSPKRDLREIKRRILNNRHTQCRHGLARLDHGSSAADFQAPEGATNGRDACLDLR